MEFLKTVGISIGLITAIVIVVVILHGILDGIQRLFNLTSLHMVIGIGTCLFIFVVFGIHHIRQEANKSDKPNKIKK